MSDIKPENINLGENTDIRGSANLNNVKIGSRTKIRDYSIIYGSKECPAKIGEDCWIGPFCYFNGIWGLEIGDRVDIATAVNVHTDSGPIETSKLAKIYPVKKGVVKIGDDVWIGANVVILPGITIGSGVVILANTVINENIPDGVLYGGMPGKIIKKFNFES